MKGVSTAVPDDASRYGTPSSNQQAVHSLQPAALPQYGGALPDWRVAADHSCGPLKYGETCEAQQGGHADGCAFSAAPRLETSAAPRLGIKLVLNLRR